MKITCHSYKPPPPLGNVPLNMAALWSSWNWRLGSSTGWAEMFLSVSRLTWVKTQSVSVSVSPPQAADQPSIRLTNSAPPPPHSSLHRRRDTSQILPHVLFLSLSIHLALMHTHNIFGTHYKLSRGLIARCLPQGVGGARSVGELNCWRKPRVKICFVSALFK